VTNRAVNGSVKFAEVKEYDMCVAGDTQQATVSAQIHSMNGEWTVVVIVCAAL